MLIAGAALWALPGRFPDRTALALFTAYFLALTLLMATDLDQRLLPDVITLPMIPIAFVAAASGIDPLVRDQLLLAVVAAIFLPAILYALSIPFGAGAIGIGDLKLLVSVGLLSGLGRSGDRRGRGCAPLRRRGAGPARDSPGHAPQLHPVRAVPDRRGVLGRACDHGLRLLAGRLDSRGIMSAKPESSPRQCPRSGRRHRRA